MARTRSDGSEPRSSRFAARKVAAVLAAAGVVLVVLGNAVAGDGSDQQALPLPTIPTETSTPTAPSFSAEPETSLEEALPSADPAQGDPLLLEVSRLGVEAPVLPIEVDGGILEPPADAREVGWDQGTAKAGSAYGGTVITGHTVHTGGGALDELDDLKQGDTVVIGTNRGRIEYVVREVTHVTKQQMVKRLPELYRGDVAGRLVLITCTDWNGVEYLANTVVLAEPADRVAAS